MVIAILLFALALFMLIGVIGTIQNIGKPREPLQGGSAAATVTIGFVMIIVMVIAGIQLHGA